MKAPSLESDFNNSAILQEETLSTVVLVLEHGWPAGPTFLHALSSLTEAVILHNKVYFDPCNAIKGGRDEPNNIGTLLRNSTIIKTLMENDALSRFPTSDLLDNYLGATERDYSYGQFVSDLYWRPYSFNYGSPEDEKNRFDIGIDLAQKGRDLLKPESLVPWPDGSHVSLVDPQVLSHLLLGRSLGMSDEDLRVVEGLNFRAKAFADLSRYTGLHLHPYIFALPHMIGAITHANSAAHRSFERVRDAIKDLDDEPENVDDTSFRRSPIPLLTGVLLGRCKDSTAAIVSELLTLRRRQRKFREFLTDYEQYVECGEDKAREMEIAK